MFTHPHPTLSALRVYHQAYSNSGLYEGPPDDVGVQLALDGYLAVRPLVVGGSCAGVGGWGGASPGGCRDMHVANCQRHALHSLTAARLPFCLPATPISPFVPLQFKLVDALPHTPACLSSEKSQTLDSVVACTPVCQLNAWGFQASGYQ